MDIAAKIRYNKKSAKKYGWTPQWFGCLDFSEVLIREIELFQIVHDLKMDGLCGEKTYRRAFTFYNEKNKPTKNVGILYHNKTPYKIDWPTKTDFIKSGCYSPHSKLRKAKMIVTHWDVCTSAANCKRVLEARKISTHLCIDNDGVIVQFVDLNDHAWHSGKTRLNKISYGIDFSDAYYLKYQKVYLKNGFGPRPMIEDAKVHGVTLKPFLGYYPIQIEAYKALLKFFNEHDFLGVPLTCPVSPDGKLIERVYQPALDGKFEGVVCHYHLLRGKIDTAGLKLDKIIEEVKSV